MAGYDAVVTVIFVIDRYLIRKKEVINTIPIKPWTGTQTIDLVGAGIVTKPSDQPVDIFRIYETSGQPLVRMLPDGRLEFGPNYDPDEAARTFWDAMARHAPAQPQLVAEPKYRCAKCLKLTGPNGHGPGVAVGRDGTPLLSCEVGGPNDPTSPYS